MWVCSCNIATSASILRTRLNRTCFCRSVSESRRPPLPIDVVIYLHRCLSLASVKQTHERHCHHRADRNKDIPIFLCSVHCTDRTHGGHCVWAWRLLMKNFVSSVLLIIAHALFEMLSVLRLYYFCLRYRPWQLLKPAGRSAYSFG